MLKADLKRPAWSAFYRSEVDRDDFMLVAKVKKMEQLNKRDLFELISKVYDSMLDDYHKNANQMINHNETTNKGKKGERTSEKMLAAYMHAANVSKNLNPTTNEGIKTIDSARSLYLSLAQVYANPMYPVFHVRSRKAHIDNHVPQNIVVFEPRYRTLIRDAMKGRKERDFKGRLIDAPRPRFIYAHGEILGPGIIAFIVEICRCRKLSGEDNITIKSVEKVRLISIRERVDLNNGLQDARFIRY